MLCNVIVSLLFSQAASSDGDMGALLCSVVILISLLKEECVCFTSCYYPNRIQNSKSNDTEHICQLLMI